MILHIRREVLEHKIDLVTLAPIRREALASPDDFLADQTTHGAVAQCHHFDRMIPLIVPCLADHASCDRSPKDDPS